MSCLGKFAPKRNRCSLALLLVAAALSTLAFLLRTPMGFVLAVYFSNWSVYGPQHFPSHLPADKLTHVFYAFMKVDPDSGRVALLDPWADVEMPIGPAKGCLGSLAALKRQHRNLKVVMSVGGWGTAQAFSSIVAARAKRDAFVASIVDLVVQHQFDGVDVDWEYPASPMEGTRLVELLQQLRSAMLAVRSGLLLTVAAPASPSHISNLHVAQMDRHLSFWNIMCYDFAGAGWLSRTAYHANLHGANGDNSFNCDATISAYCSLGVATDKLVLGMPMYGRSFYEPESPTVGVPFNSNSPYESDTIDYKDIPTEKVYFDSNRTAAFTFDKAKNLVITYDSPRCAREKARYVKKRGLRGGFWWDSKGDSEHSLVGAFVELLGPKALETQENWV